MDKPKEKKHIHLNAEEKLHVAELIANGATYNEVNSWHLMRFGKVMAKSKFYNHKVKHKKSQNLTPKCVHHGWWKSGLQKFRHLKSDQELEITEDYIQHELNEKLETALVLSEN